MIVPSLLISLLTMLGFALPAESGEKITLGNNSGAMQTICYAIIVHF